MLDLELQARGRWRGGVGCLAFAFTVSHAGLARAEDPPPPLAPQGAPVSESQPMSDVAKLNFKRQVNWELSRGSLKSEYIPARRMRNAGVIMSAAGGAGLAFTFVGTGVVAYEGGFNDPSYDQELVVILAVTGLFSFALLGAGIPLAIMGKARKIELRQEAERRVGQRPLTLELTAPGGPALRF